MPKPKNPKRRDSKPQIARKRARREGQRAEFIAACYLRFKGYRIVARNLRMAGGEIDLVARRGRLLVFVEVKFRPHMKQAEAAIMPRQWRRIEQAAGQFVGTHPKLQNCQWRFDLLALAQWRWPRHKPGSWRANTP